MMVFCWDDIESFLVTETVFLEKERARLPCRNTVGPLETMKIEQDQLPKEKAIPLKQLSPYRMIKFVIFTTDRCEIEDVVWKQ